MKADYPMGEWMRHCFQHYAPATPAACIARSNASRMPSILARFAPKSYRPSLDAERKWMTFASRSSRNSTSSTKRNNRLTASTWRYPSRSATTFIRPIAARTPLSRRQAASASPSNRNGVIRRLSSLAWVHTQFGVPGQSLSRSSRTPNALFTFFNRGDLSHGVRNGNASTPADGPRQ